MSLYFADYIKRFSGDVHFYGNASHALYDLLGWLQENNPKARPNIVLPIYIPAKIYRLILAAGYRPKFYEVQLNLRMDIQEVKSLIDDQTQAVLYIHYFGVPSRLGDLKSYTAVNNVFLIEDCSHTIGIEGGAGETGDGVIFSSRKMLQFPAGGFMVLKKKLWRFEPRYTRRVSSFFTACKLAQTRSKYLYFQFTRGIDPLKLARTYRRGYINFAETHKVEVKNISRLNYICMKATDLDKVARVRRANYEYLFNELHDIPFIKPLPVNSQKTGLIISTATGFRLRNDVVPSSLPVLVPVGTRDMLLGILKEAGIGCGVGWPESPFGHKGFNRAIELSERLLELPVHPGINHHQLDRIIHCLNTCHNDQNRESIIISTRNSKAEVA